ncbi:membrane protein insertase YidC [Arenimonas composti]|uniref:Membrane protein insertase YidC n=1 Tax=Arenimonas composti TR7-09 = DSM 18010 TaxID=1121013 RepID=A0A091BIX1_9GAMM|nr:membrane protein insertase YidC [Arenimonas composti]KFN50739.1 hypothetical protein P873_06130 [Arenimonas composti TR7-09 = DSM 18010]
MNQTRTFLLFAWIAVAVLLFMRWNEPTAVVPAADPTAAAIPADAPPVLADDGSAPPTAPSTGPLPEAAPAPVVVETNARTISVASDVLDLRIDTRGGTLVGAELLQYPVKKETPDVRVQLLSGQPRTWSVAHSGLAAVGGGAAPTHEALFQVEGGQTAFRLADGADSLEVPLLWTDPATGLSVRKVFVLSRGSYAVTVRHEIANRGAAPWRGFGYTQLQRAIQGSGGYSFTNPETYSFVGAAWYDPIEKFEKVKTEDLIDDGALSRDATGGWIGMLQHHFAVAWIPATDEPQKFTMQALAGNQRYQVRGIGAAFEVAPGSELTREVRIWVGPKLQEQMQQIAPGLNKTLDYGIFTFIAQPMFDYVLSPLHKLTGNWGWAIILTVVIIKLALLWVSAKQYKSAARMRAIQPRLEALKERYGDDRNKYAQAQMELFRKEKINPLGGCVPILVTFPIFIALYYMLLESVEMRQAPWIGWIQNLTAPDPYYVLPALNLAVMYLTQKMTPMPGMDPMQKKMMTFMPLAFGVVMAFFPAGLVLYWCTNGLLGLLQQWIMTRRYGGATPAKAAAK